MQHKWQKMRRFPRGFQAPGRKQKGGKGGQPCLICPCEHEVPDTNRKKKHKPLHTCMLSPCFRSSCSTILVCVLVSRGGGAFPVLRSRLHPARSSACREGWRRFVWRVTRREGGLCTQHTRG